MPWGGGVDAGDAIRVDCGDIELVIGSEEAGRAVEIGRTLDGGVHGHRVRFAYVDDGDGIAVERGDVSPITENRHGICAVQTRRVMHAAKDDECEWVGNGDNCQAIAPLTCNKCAVSKDADGCGAVEPTTEDGCGKCRRRGDAHVDDGEARVTRCYKHKLRVQ